ncbi:hypothetical protein DKP91_14975 [Enterococcus faecium]|uniref:Uncharacterized protein n=2 Tax=Enterococcus faecium TaxID=1352 RepID=A0AB73TNZ8_ENTFC|nr:hypothetical protein DKP91_14975 [Enterococcus faecium]
MSKEPMSAWMQLALSIIKLISNFVALDNRAKVLTTQCLVILTCSLLVVIVFLLLALFVVHLLFFLNKRSLFNYI